MHLAHRAIFYPSSCSRYDLYAADACITFIHEVSKEASGEIEHNQKQRRLDRL
jgi:hypothetical protein